MNRFLLFLGSLLLLVLCAALVVPRFIDWSNYTTIIEEQASRVLGREVHVSGAVDLRLLPMPRLTFSDVEIASREDGSEPELTVARAQALMSLAPFLSGKAHIVELTLDEPVVRLSNLQEGASPGGSDGFDLGAVRVDEAIITNGRVERLGPDGALQVLMEGLDAKLSAQSLLGPWRVDPASAVIGGEPVSLRINTGAYDGDRRMRMRVSVLPHQRPIDITVDGFLDWSQSDARFEGRGRAQSVDSLASDEAGETTGQQGVQPLTWRIEGDLDASLDALQAQGVELTLGQAQDQAFVLTGSGRLGLGDDAAFSADISSRQVDLDRMLGGGAAAPVDLAAGWQAAGSLVAWVNQLTLPGEVAFDIPAIVLGGSVIRDIGFGASFVPEGQLRLEALQATFPGETQLGFSGHVEAVGTRALLAVQGQMSLESAAPDLFVAWSTGRGDEAGTFSQLTSLQLAGDIVARPEEVSVERLRGAIDDAALEGSIIWREVAGLGPQLDVMLDAGRFDFGLLAGLGGWMTQGSAGSAALVDRINADLSIAELVAGPENLGGVSVSLASTPQRVRIDQLAIGDAAGAQISASGVLDRGAFPPLGFLQFDADMERLGGVARLARDVFGEHPALVDFVRNAGLYAPASLSGRYEHSDDSGMQVRLDGTLAASQVSLIGVMPPVEDVSALPTGLGSLFERAASLRLSARAQDAFALVGQLGFAALPSQLGGEGTALFDLTSDGQSAPTLRLAFDGLESALRVDGVLTGSANDGVTGFDGGAELFVGDVAQLGLMAGMALPGIFDPISATAAFDLAYDVAAARADLAGISGTFADVPLQGSGQWTPGQPVHDVQLDLSVDQLDLPQLLAGFVGPVAFDQGFSTAWPQGPLAFNPLAASLTLALSTPSLRVWEGLEAQAASLELRVEKGDITLERFTGSLLGGRLDGRLALREADLGAIATGRLTLTDLALERFAWRSGDEPVLRGDLSTRLRFESAGGSLAQLMAGLTGEGTLALSDVTVDGLGLSGFTDVLQSADAGLFDDENDPDLDLEAFLSEALAREALSIDAADSPVSVVGGVAQFSNLYLDGQSTALRGQASLDIAQQRLEALLAYEAVEGPGDVEAMPAIGLAFEGALGAPQRQLDVSQLASFLEVRALEQEIRRVESLNAEILERERLLRVMGAIELDDERLAALQERAAQAERDRLAAEEAERARIEADRLATQEAARQAELARERALREALPAREREALNRSTPSALDLGTPQSQVLRTDPITTSPGSDAEANRRAREAPLSLTP